LGQAPDALAELLVAARAKAAEHEALGSDGPVRADGGDGGSKGGRF